MAFSQEEECERFVGNSRHDGSLGWKRARGVMKLMIEAELPVFFSNLVWALRETIWSTDGDLWKLTILLTFNFSGISLVAYGNLSCRALCYVMTTMLTRGFRSRLISTFTFTFSSNETL